MAGDSRLKILNEPIPSKRYLWRLDRQRMVGILDIPNSTSKQIQLPLVPMLGRVAVAPSGEEAFGGMWPGNFGGNMDASDVREGTTVYLPIFHDGAYFYFGDGHALQGDGEICGSGLETTMDVSLQFDLMRGQGDSRGVRRHPSRQPGPEAALLPVPADAAGDRARGREQGVDRAE